MCNTNIAPLFSYEQGFCSDDDPRETKWLIEDCFNDLNLKHLASKVRKLDERNSNELCKYVKIVESIAQKNNRHDVIERLYFANLVYG